MCEVVPSTLYTLHSALFYGEMAERLKAVASKAIVRIADRGFESLSLRHSTQLLPVPNLSRDSWQARE